MATLTPQRPAFTAAAPTYNACAVGGDTVPNDGHVLLHFKSSAGGSLTCKVDDPVTTVPGATSLDADVTITIPAGTERIVGPFSVERFGSALALTYPGGVTGLTLAVMGA